mmetsp:Transcript_41021/g.131158  ORF Transcript_41021/g.131158 Transcript_41021/m.131158 type:complete len:150 (+) Transcript_41021:750-1199(+)
MDLEQDWFILPALAILVALCLLESVVAVLEANHEASVGARARKLRQEIAALRRKAAPLNNPSTFSQAAKLQRQANAKEKELAALGEGGAARPQGRSAQVLSASKVAVWVAGGLWYARGPVLQVPVGLLGYLGTTAPPSLAFIIPTTPCA